MTSHLKAETAKLTCLNSVLIIGIIMRLDLLVKIDINEQPRLIFNGDKDLRR